MRYFSADYIFDGYCFLPSDQVIVLDDAHCIHNIIHHPNNNNVQHIEGLLMPGMVNAHCHLELSHLKGEFKEHTGLVDFLLNVNQQRQKFSAEAIQNAIELAEKQMLDNGIVAVGDISNTIDSLSQKKKGNLIYHTFVECVGLLDSNALERFTQYQDILNQFKSHHQSSLVLHAPYSVSNSLINYVDQVSIDQITSIHNQECEAENEIFEKGEGDFLKLFNSILGGDFDFLSSGKTSLQTYFPKLKNQQHLILVHNTISNDTDIQFANSFGKRLFYCLCPNANLYIENRLPYIDMLMQNGCKIVLGTDSLASNHQLSIVSEMITIQKKYPSILLEEILKWATSNGAYALGMEDKIGSFEKGKKPGLVQIKNVSSQTHLPEKPEMNRIV
ncbi:MAG TPA: amidohydrolase family protein [Chitinophagaceae bacterium]|nr:amidohydrolase family protein [Chitinophagaceae bacterium]